jgi:hypothetical protein
MFNPSDENTRDTLLYGALMSAVVLVLDIFLAWPALTR